MLVPLELGGFLFGKQKMQIAQLDNTKTMSSRTIAEVVKSRHADVMRCIERLIEKGVIPGYTAQAYTHEQNGQQYAEYFLGKRDSYVVVAQLSPEFTADLVDRWQELETNQVKTNIALPNFANPAEAARAWALQYEARIHAEATKAEIGNRREATAMNTASQAVKKATKLEIELDKSKEYATVKRMEMLYHGTKFNWRLLKSTAIDMEVPPIDVFDANYGKVNSYHASVWLEAYAVSVDGQA